MKERPPVHDWATDFDHNHPDWAADPYPIWEDLRERCPVAHTERYRGVFLPVRTDDIREIAYDPEHFSSRRIMILDGKPPVSAPIPPVTSDPPLHRAQRMMLLPAFTPDEIDKLRPITRAMCNELIDAFIAKGRCDAAVDYAQHVPTRVIAGMLGLAERDHDQFRRWIYDMNIDGTEDLGLFKTHGGGGRRLLRGRDREAQARTQGRSDQLPAEAADRRQAPDDGPYAGHVAPAAIRRHRYHLERHRPDLAASGAHARASAAAGR